MSKYVCVLLDEDDIDAVFKTVEADSPEEAANKAMEGINSETVFCPMVCKGESWEMLFHGDRGHIVVQKLS